MILMSHLHFSTLTIISLDIFDFFSIIRILKLDLLFNDVFENNQLLHNYFCFSHVDFFPLLSEQFVNFQPMGNLR